MAMNAALGMALAALAACGGGGDPFTDPATSGSAAADAGKATPTLQATNDPGWITVADEGGRYTASGLQTVRYGTGSTWITAQVNGGGDCSNAAFGNDPAYGIVKVCQVAAPVATTWSRIAGEGEAFTVGSDATVRYGAGSSFVTRTLSGAGTCSNDFFGNDPNYGVVKSCEIAAAGSTPPTPSPSPSPPTPPPTVAGVCMPPVGALDTSATAASVGDGTAASCTESTLKSALAGHTVVRFDCGAAPVTIAIATTIELPANRDTVIDGDNRITLDGGGRARLFNIDNRNYRTNTFGLTLQHIALRNGKAPGGGYVAPNPANAACAYGYAEGSGAAIKVNDARLHVIDVDFQGNAAASPGPDVGGGAIYAGGSLDVLVSGSRFSGNSGSNAGAIGALQSNLRVYNSVFTGNSASGVGANFAGGAATGCAGVGHPGQGGAGGNGGAIGIDGSDDTDVIVCGSQFSTNTSNELAGAIFRTANVSARRMTIDRSTFQGNTARQGGALYLQNQVPLEITASTFSGNRAALFGAAHLQNTQLSMVNTTFSGNEATQGLGGALFLNGTNGASLIQNTTFADNRASGGAGYFSAAIFGDTNFPIVNTVFANNTTLDPFNPMQCGFAAATGANDVQWPMTRLGGATDSACVVGIVFADPLLGALGANGGPTATQVPGPGSPLRNAGRDCPTTDQRGNPRNPASCTVGAVE